MLNGLGGSADFLRSAKISIMVKYFFPTHFFPIRTAFESQQCLRELKDSRISQMLFHDTNLILTETF